jgi:hypothetical protein
MLHCRTSHFAQGMHRKQSQRCPCFLKFPESPQVSPKTRDPPIAEMLQLHILLQYAYADFAYIVLANGFAAFLSSCRTAIAGKLQTRQQKQEKQLQCRTFFLFVLPGFTHETALYSNSAISDYYRL